MKRATKTIDITDGKYSISIHALREEGDEPTESETENKEISIHALREEGDLTVKQAKTSKVISIHALREEGDGNPVLHQCIGVDFNPRPL